MINNCPPPLLNGVLPPQRLERREMSLLTFGDDEN